MDRQEAQASDTAATAPSASPALTESLIKTLPDLLFLLADTREQLDQVRLELAESRARFDTEVQAEAKLLEMIAAMQGDTELMTEEMRGLRDRVAAAEGRASELEEHFSTTEDTSRHQVEAVRQADIRAETAEAQLREIRASRSWRMGNPVRRAGAKLRTIIGRSPG
jgi:chromosome segregation ATPase